MAYEVRANIVEVDSATGDVARFLEGSARMRGLVTNSARVWANIPHIAKLQLLSGVTLQREGGGGVLSCRIKEMAVLKTSHINTCAY